jgi:predicted DNA binding CopG/RHH family protein
MKKATTRKPGMEIDSAAAIRAHAAGSSLAYPDPKEREKAERELEAKTTLRLPRELWNAVRHRAIDEGVSFQFIVEKALEAYLKGDKS